MPPNKKNSIVSSLVTIIGGIVFLAFALSALFFKPDAGINWRKRDSFFLCKYVEK